VNAALPAATELGFRAVSVGEGLSTAKVCPPDVPPPGAGVETVTVAVPLAARSAAVICACSCVLDTKVVVRAQLRSSE
jgi:hypothetical protein